MDDGWTGEARALLERAVARHGGWDVWDAGGGVSLAPVNLAGMLPWMKGAGRTFRLPPRADTWPRAGRTVFRDYPAPGHQGIFEAGAVRLVDDAGAVRVESARHRETFRGLRAYRRWSPLDALYFFGYALAHYHGLPFSLADARPLGLRRARFDGDWLAGVEVELPASLHTHSRRQTFYFDGTGLLRRHDYVADVIGWWARGAHCWHDFVTLPDGMRVARRRTVYARLDRRALPVVALDAELTDVRPLAPG
jgi:hypothetical protein